MKYIKVTLQTILIVFLLCAVLLVLMSRMPVFGIQSMVVLTGSMEPTIATGSIVFVQKATNYEKGDILTFKNQNGNHVTHRLVEKVEQKFQLKGDANNEVDSSLIDPEQVVGKTVFFLPYLGRFSEFLKTPLGFVGFIVVPSLLFVGYELWNIKKELVKITETRLLEKMKVHHEQ